MHTDDCILSLKTYLQSTLNTAQQLNINMRSSMVHTSVYAVHNGITQFWLVLEPVGAFLTNLVFIFYLNDIKYTNCIHIIHSNIRIYADCTLVRNIPIQSVSTYHISFSITRHWEWRQMMSLLPEFSPPNHINFSVFSII